MIKALKTWKEINPVESNAENSEKPGAKNIPDKGNNADATCVRVL